MATKIQRKSLWHMIKHDGRAFIFTGQKSTEWYSRERFGPIIRGSLCLLHGLRANRWIEIDPDVANANVDFGVLPLATQLNLGRAAYRITESGRKAAGKSEPVMKVKWTGAHGVRWE